jgi:hypothetical protein
MWFFLALGIAMLAYGITMASAIWSGGWFRAEQRRARSSAP